MNKLIVRVDIIDNNIYLCKGVKIENGMIISDGKKLSFPINRSRGELDGAGCNNYEQVVSSNDQNIDVLRLGDYFKNNNNIPKILLLDYDNKTKSIKFDINKNIIVSEPRMFNISEVYDLCQLALATPCDSSKYADNWCNEYILNSEEIK
ncbi:hypothetical protein M0Q50_06155 [bacterium]|jgi:hypothetical protein|nr:hypothetical protein [bacterium]